MKLDVFKRVLLSLLIVAVLVVALKIIVGQPRPEGATALGFGFPSVHTAYAFALVPFIGTSIFTLSLASLVAVWRLLAGQHTFIQVVGGAAIGYTVSFIVKRVRSTKDD